jgi:hypothetical protein
MADVENLVRHCDGCQSFAKRIHVPAHEIQTIPASWPFACWGLDKFSKWIEYMPLTKASSEKAVEFLDQIIHRFGLSNSIITDLGT